MSNLYTIIVLCDGGDEIEQEIAISPAHALDQWMHRSSPNGIIESLSHEDITELREDFSAEKPTHFGLGVAVEDLEGVWRASTPLKSGKYVEVFCVRCSAACHQIITPSKKTEQAEQAETD